MRRLLAHRDARRYLFGQLLSSFGDTALWLALAIWIKMLTGSAAAAGLSFFMIALGMLFSPLGGLLADRVRRRPLLITANAGTAAMVLLLLLVRGQGQLWLIYAVMFGYGVSSAVLAPAQTALLQALVPEELLAAANSVLQTAQWGMRLVTPLLGAGLLAAFGPAPVVIGDAATFVVAVLTLATLQVAEQRPTPSGERLVAEAAGGMRHIRRSPVLRQATLATVLAVCAFGLSEPAVFAVVAQGLHRPDAFVGVLTAAQGGGAVVAGASAAPVLRRIGEHRLLAVGLGVAAAGFLLQTAATLPTALSGAGLLGAGLPWITVGLMTLFQRLTPPALMGRTQAALTVALSLPQTVAIALGAALISVLGYRFLLLAVALLAALGAVYLSTRRASAPPQHRADPLPVAHPGGADGAVGRLADVQGGPTAVPGKGEVGAGAVADDLAERAADGVEVLPHGGGEGGIALGAADFGGDQDPAEVVREPGERHLAALQRGGALGGEPELVPCSQLGEPCGHFGKGAHQLRAPGAEQV
jgi:MFS family permease